MEPLGHFGSVTERTLEGHAELGRPSRFFGYPGSKLKRWTVTNMLVVATLELCHPFGNFVLVVGGDCSFHDGQRSCALSEGASVSAPASVFRGWVDSAQRQHSFGVSLFFEEFLAGFEKVELGDESVEMVSVSAVDDGEDAEPEGGHAVGHAAQDLVGMGHDRSGDHGLADPGVGLVLAGEDG